MPVDTIEGIGPATVLKLAPAGVRMVADLLLAPPAALAPTTGLGVEQLEAWRAAALFLELPSLNAQWAEALVEGGITGMEMLMDAEEAALEACFAAAREAGRIPDVPDAATRMAMRLEATRHQFGARVHGRCVDADGAPLEGVQVYLGDRTTTSNAQGYWLFHSLDLGDSFTVFLHKEGYLRRALSHLPAFRDPLVIDLPLISMEEGPDEPIVFDEYAGDALPPLDSYHARQVIKDASGLRQNDLLKVTRHYTNGDVKLISVLLSTSDQYLNIPCFRLSGQVFRDVPPLGTYYMFAGRQLHRVDMGEESVYIMKAFHKERLRRLRDGEHSLEAFDAATFSINAFTP